MAARLTGNLSQKGATVGIFDTTLHQVAPTDPNTDALMQGTITLDSGKVIAFSTTLSASGAPPEGGTPPGEPGVNPGAPPPPPQPAVKPGSTGRVLTVGPGYTVAQQMAAANPGDTIAIPPGTPREAFGIDKPVLIEATGVVWDFTDQELFQRKAAIVPLCNGWHIRGIEISGAGINEGEAQLTCAIRIEADGWGTIEKCSLHGNQNGIGAGSYNWHITVLGCDLRHNGLGDGQTHNIYCNNGHTLSLTDTVSVEPTAGHCVKSRAWHTTIEGGMLSVNDGGCIDCPEGGLLTVRNAVVNKPANAEDHKFLMYAEENRNRGALDTSTLDGCVFELFCPQPFATVEAGTVTFGPACTWEGNKPEARGAGMIVGFPA